MTKMVELLRPYKRLENDSRYTVVRGGRGSAKSFHVSAYLLTLTYKPGEVILYTRYTMTSAKRSIIPEFQEKMDLMQCGNDFVSSENTITNRLTGSRIIFSGIKTSSGNQTAALKSITGLTVWVLDEAEEMMSSRDFDKIDDSIRKKDGSNRVFLVFNTDRVDKQHWIYKRFFQSGEYENATYIHTTYLDNIKNLDTSFLQKVDLIKREDPEFYEVNYLGEFPTLRDVVFPKGFKTYEAEPENFDWQGIGGDFGFVDSPSTAILVTKHKERLYLRELIYGFGLTNKEIAEGLSDDQKKLVNVWDSAERKSIHDLRIMNVNAFPAQKKAGSVFQGIKKIQQLEIYVQAKSKNIQEEFLNYKWKRKNDGEYFRDSLGNRVPIKAHDHCIDPTRYVLHAMHAWD